MNPGMLCPRRIKDDGTSTNYAGNTCQTISIQYKFYQSVVNESRSIHQDPSMTKFRYSLVQLVQAEYTMKKLDLKKSEPQRTCIKTFYRRFIRHLFLFFFHWTCQLLQKKISLHKKYNSVMEVSIVEVENEGCNQQDNCPDGTPSNAKIFTRCCNCVSSLLNSHKVVDKSHVTHWGGRSFRSVVRFIKLIVKQAWSI